VNVELTVNGTRRALDLAPQELLLDVLRDRLDLRGAKRSCEVQVCGACTVLLDGDPVSACCTLAADAEGREVLTIEGLADQPEFTAIADAFTHHAALQCGFCTPGLVLTVKALLDSGELSGSHEIAQQLSGNLCRCTGYRGILEAVCELAGVER
jgi:aerobic-type carbon monoxide dehydrogenase small subunit (CoxS/CutS family)